MKLQIGSFYILVIDVCGVALTFHCQITGEDEDSVEFIDKFEKRLSYSKRQIISSEKINGD